MSNGRWFRTGAFPSGYLYPTIGAGGVYEKSEWRETARGGRRDADEARQSGGVVPINQIDWCDVEHSQSPSPSSLSLSHFLPIFLYLSVSLSLFLCICPDRMATVHIQRVQSQIPLIRSLQYKFNPN